MNGGEVRYPNDRAAGELDTENAPAGLPRVLAEDAEAVVGKHALHDELALLELTPLDLVARRPFGGSPDDRHRLEILRTDRRKELLDGRPRFGRAGEWTSSPRTAGSEYGNERDDRTLHGEAPSVLVSENLLAS